MDEKTHNEHNSVTFTNAQFRELQKFLQGYLRVMALSGTKENEIERNVWLLDSANYSQEEIGRILHVSQPTISRVLAGKATKKEGRKMSRRKKEANQTISIEPRQFNTMIKAAQNLIKVYASGQIRRDAGTAVNARFLRVFDFSEQEIADLLGISQPAVHQALSKTKKDKTKTPSTGSDDSSEKA